MPDMTDNTQLPIHGQLKDEHLRLYRVCSRPVALSVRAPIIVPAPGMSRAIDLHIGLWI